MINIKQKPYDSLEKDKQLIINTNVNNYCISPPHGQQQPAQNISNTKNINNITNNYNIYPGGAPTLGTLVPSEIEQAP